MANRVVGAKRHDLCGPRDKFSTFFRSRYSIGYLEYQSFFVNSKYISGVVAPCKGILVFLSCVLPLLSVAPKRTWRYNLLLLIEARPSRVLEEPKSHDRIISAWACLGSLRGFSSSDCVLRARVEEIYLGFGLQSL